MNEGYPGQNLRRVFTAGQKSLYTEQDMTLFYTQLSPSVRRVKALMFFFMICSLPSPGHLVHWESILYVAILQLGN